MFYIVLTLYVFAATGKPAPKPKADPQIPIPLGILQLHPNPPGMNRQMTPDLRQMYQQSHLTPENEKAIAGVRQEIEDYKINNQNEPATSSQMLDNEADKVAYNEAEAAISTAVSKAVGAIMNHKEMADKLTELTRVAGETIGEAASSVNGDKTKSPSSEQEQGPGGELGISYIALIDESSLI